MAYSDIIVTVHGIGKQNRCETVRSAATRLASSQTLSAGGASHPVAPQPLGFFHPPLHSDVENFAFVTLLDDPAALTGAALDQIGFAEVFWADIPQEVAQEGRTLEETKAWAHTLVARAHATCLRAQAAQKAARAQAPPGTPPDLEAKIVPPDFGLAAEVVDEIVDAIYVLENLLFLAGKAGVFKFDLRKVLVEYIGDVQLVTEFTYHRLDVVGRFHAAMESIYANEIKGKDNPPKIHIVAHSEGTVVSFLGLLHAMGETTVAPVTKDHPARLEPTPGKIPAWLPHVHGFMTFGSPIDKHLLLWPRLWTGLKPTSPLVPAARIKWRNYYDYGDPIGFELDTARLWLDWKGCRGFDFTKDHDYGFSRYLFPGEAHNEYWNDPEVFEHFVKDVVRPCAPQPNPPPKSLKSTAAMCNLLPYALSLALVALGVFILFKALHHFTHPSDDPFQRFLLYYELGLKPSRDLSTRGLAGAVAGLTLLVAGATLMARFPRLSYQWQWKILGVVMFAAGALGYLGLVPAAVQLDIGPAWQVILGAFVAGAAGWLACASAGTAAERHKRLIWKGTRPLIAVGALATALVVWFEMTPSPPLTELTRAEQTLVSSNGTWETYHELLKPMALESFERKDQANWWATVKKVEPALALHPPAWPVWLAAAAAIYLWWLATLIFDLAFIWHRYVRRSVVNLRLREWGERLVRAGATQA
ncbi:MAG TPA: hypothetical protein VHB20_05655 [Verrucomicrobiae bacterium]|jgi:hypothetical protein|nr:hypothetical protein [Verrucomicrobiae bacterium]